MQIDLVITELDVGGAERALTRLATGLQERGDDVRVFSLGSLPASGFDASGVDSLVTELRYHDIEVTSGEATAIGSLAAVYRKLRSWLKQRPKAVRQSFLFHANVLTMAATPSNCRGPWIAGVRVADPNRIRIAIEGHALRCADQVVCVSSAVASFAQHRYAIPASRLAVIGNAVETERFANAVPLDWQSLDWPADASVVLFIGRLHPQKNIQLLQRTLDQFAPIGSDRKLVIVGRGPLAAELQSWVDGVPGDRVRLLDWQPDVATLIAASRLVVLPSHYEGMPNVVLEAMAAGKPVVCSRVEGSRELIGDDPDQGFDLEHEDQFAAKVNRFLNDADFAARIGAANQDRMAQEFSVQRMVNAYRELYAKLGS